MCVCVYVCMYVCMYVCVYAMECGRLWHYMKSVFDAYLEKPMCERQMHVVNFQKAVYFRVTLHMYACMYVCMCVCVYMRRLWYLWGGCVPSHGQLLGRALNNARFEVSYIHTFIYMSYMRKFSTHIIYIYIYIYIYTFIYVSYIHTLILTDNGLNMGTCRTTGSASAEMLVTPDLDV
jgi:hypothetical protein